MAANFYSRLREYYLKVAAVLRGEADAASIFRNSGDVGSSREQVYASFLRQHAPSKCNIFLGGFLFDNAGVESKQLDIIVTTDTAPRFDFHNRDGVGKAFSPVEGTLGVVSIKSRLDKAQLHDALDGIASIPPTESLEGRVAITIGVNNYEDWPYKVIYATDGLNAETIFDHLSEYYRQNKHIPVSRRPHVIHVAGKYAIIRVLPGMSLKHHLDDADTSLEVGTFHITANDPDLQGIVWVLNGLQKNAATSTHILYKYNELINRVLEPT
jgi:hypothetical protein